MKGSMVTLLSGDHQPRAFGTPDVPGHNDSEARPKEKFIELGSSDFAHRNRSTVSVEALRLAGDGTACDVGHERITGANPGDGVHFRRVHTLEPDAGFTDLDRVSVDDAGRPLDPFRSVRDRAEQAIGEHQGLGEAERFAMYAALALAAVVVAVIVGWRFVTGA